MTREQLDVYPVPPGHGAPGETTEDEDLVAGGSSPRRRQSTDPRVARACRRLEAIALSAAILTFGLLAVAHGPTLMRGSDTAAAPAKPSTVMDERAFSVAAYQPDWVSYRDGERGANQIPARWLAVPAYQADWTTQRAGERATITS
jgi:hypothetical protein